MLDLFRFHVVVVSHELLLAISNGMFYFQKLLNGIAADLIVCGRKVGNGDSNYNDDNVDSDHSLLVPFQSKKCSQNREGNIYCHFYVWKTYLCAVAPHPLISDVGIVRQG